MRRTYEADILVLYAAYFSRPTPSGDLLVLEARPDITKTTAELLRGMTIVDVEPSPPKQRYEADAKQARREQIRRNGGKR